MKTQKQLILEYIRTYGSIIPARVGGSPFRDGFFGSEVCRRARELRNAGTLISKPAKENPKFEEFFISGQIKLL